MIEGMRYKVYLLLQWLVGAPSYGYGQSSPMELTEERLVDFDAKKLRKWYRNLVLTIRKLCDSPQGQIQEAARALLAKIRVFQEALKDRHDFLRKK